jgi:hypothetical protein
MFKLPWNGNYNTSKNQHWIVLIVDNNCGGHRGKWSFSWNYVIFFRWNKSERICQIRRGKVILYLRKYEEYLQ